MKKFSQVICLVFATLPTLACGMAETTPEQQGQGEVMNDSSEPVNPAYDAAVVWVYQARIDRLTGEIIECRAEEERCQQDLNVLSDPNQIAETREWLAGWRNKRQQLEQQRVQAEDALILYSSRTRGSGAGSAPSEAELAQAREARRGPQE